MISKILTIICIFKGFPGSLAGKESTCNSGDTSSIPGSGQEDSLEKGSVTTPVYFGFLCGSEGKESDCDAGHLGSIPGLGRSPGREHGNPLLYPYLENPHGQRSLAGYSSWGCKELDILSNFHMVFFKVVCFRKLTRLLGSENK